MKFTVNRLLMYQAVKTVLKIVRPNKEIPELGGLLIEADESSGMLTITGTDIRTHIQRRLRLEHIEESGGMILKPILAEMLYLLTDEFVELESEKNLVTLRSGSCQYTISSLAAKSFPKLQIPFPEDTIQVKGINSLIRRTVFAANGDNIDYNRAGFSYVKISFRGGMATAEATDGSCIAVTASPHCADGDLDMILHEKALTVLDSVVNPNEELYVGIVGKVAVFMKEDLFFSTMLFTGNYLEASKLLSNFHGSYQATIDAKQLYELVSGLSVIFDTKDDKCINLRINRQGLRPGYYRRCSSASVKAAGTIPTPADGFHYRPKLLTDCLRRLAGPVQMEIDQQGFAVMNANGSRYFISPRGPARIYQEENPEKKPKGASKKAKTKTTAAKAA
ncbi:MAG: hypothetical protein ACLR30_12830 [[Clostridium] leptum]